MKMVESDKQYFVTLASCSNGSGEC